MRATYAIRIEYRTGEVFEFVTVTDDAQRFLRVLSRSHSIVFSDALPINLEARP